jgi:hypothetical protein
MASIPPLSPFPKTPSIRARRPDRSGPAGGALRNPPSLSATAKILLHITFMPPPSRLTQVLQGISGPRRVLGPPIRWCRMDAIFFLLPIAVNLGTLFAFFFVVAVKRG